MSATGIMPVSAACRSECLVFSLVCLIVCRGITKFHVCMFNIHSVSGFYVRVILIFFQSACLISVAYL